MTTKRKRNDPALGVEGICKSKLKQCFQEENMSPQPQIESATDDKHAYKIKIGFLLYCVTMIQYIKNG